VNRSRLWLFVILIYVGLDLCLPEMPGAFIFDSDGWIESVDVAPTRLTGKLVSVPPLVMAAPQVSQQQLRDLVPRLPSRNQAPPPGHVMTRRLPRTACALPLPSEDPH
jgi:hypothetical protein